MHTAPIIIASPDNRTFKALCKLTDARGQKKQERTLVAGAKLVREFICERPGQCCTLIVCDGVQCHGMDDVVQQFAGQGNLTVLKRGLFSQLDIFNTGAPLLEVMSPGIPQWGCRLAGQGCVLALPFQDPVNVGAAARSAAAFGVQQVVLLREAASPFHPKSVRASGGAVFKLSFFRGPSLAELVQLPEVASHIVALDMQGASILQFSFPAQFLLLPGIEGQGLPEELRRQAVSIPMPGAVESLNAATAVSIALFCWSTGRNENLTTTTT